MQVRHSLWSSSKKGLKHNERVTSFDVLLGHCAQQEILKLIQYLKTKSNCRYLPLFKTHCLTRAYCCRQSLLFHTIALDLCLQKQAILDKIKEAKEALSRQEGNQQRAQVKKEDSVSPTNEVIEIAANLQASVWRQSY